MSNDVLRILRAADELLADESRWTQDGTARDGNDRLCLAGSPAAASWCLYGALIRACDVPGHINAVCDLLYAETPDGFINWNDDPERTFPEVKALLRRTIERVEAESE